MNTKASQLTRTDRDVIATVKRIADAETIEEMRRALDGTTGEGTRDENLWITSLAILSSDARELVGIIRRLTGEDL